MNEIFTNVSDNAKRIAEIAWDITMAQKTPLAAAEFLHNVTEYYQHTLTEEEVDFLRFYFNMRMEMMKE